jgi:hypothetical protein
MKSEEEHLDRMVDLLLCELVGEEAPPDVRARLRGATEGLPVRGRFQARPAPVLAALKSARRSKAPAIAIAALVTLLAAAGVMIQLGRISAARSPLLTEFSGTVDRPAGPLAAGESLSTESLTKALLTYRDGTVVELGSDTTIVVKARSIWDRSKGIELVKGGFEAEIAPQPEGKPFRLESRDARAEVVGTRLSFHRDTDRSRLEVTEGAVRFVPRSRESGVLVEAGFFAEAGSSGLRHGEIAPPPVPGITRFTLMNADTDEPIREAPLANGEKIALSSLPTKRINIRADFEGEPPVSVTIDLRRNHHENPTGLAGPTTKVQRHAPYFVAGNHWADGRPEDCAAWTPPTGFYQLSAEATYADADKQALSKVLSIRFSITP